MNGRKRTRTVLLAASVWALFGAVLVETGIRLSRASLLSPTAALFGALMLLALGVYLALHLFRFTPEWEKEPETRTPLAPAPPPDAASDLAAIVESSEDAIVSLSLEGRVLTWNRAAERTFGYSPSEIVGKSIFLLVPFGKGQELQEALKRLVRGEAVPSYETLLIRKDSAAVEVSISLSPIVDSEARPVRLSCIARELSDRRRAEHLIHQLSRVVEQTADLVLITDAQGVVEYVNPAFEKMTGYTKAEVIGGKPNILKSGEHDNAFYADMWKRILAGEAYQNEITNRRKDGTLFHTEKTISPIRDETGRITHFVSTDKDVTIRHIMLEEATNLIAREASSARKGTNGASSGSHR